MNRTELIKELENQLTTVWDVIVIGGGSTGLGIAVDSASRGYKTLLLEQADFASGTSSRSTKLVHGGVRYMAKGDLFLVIEALKERGILLKNAPHLTFNQEFVIPVYSFWEVLLYTIGLKFYDILAGRLSLGKSHFITLSETLIRLPLLKSKGLKGGVVYHDGQFDDSRLAFALVKVCREQGGLLLNYFKATKLLKSEKGKVTGLVARDLISGKEYSINAGLVINATGIFADEIARLDNPKSVKSIRPSQGVHIVLDKSFMQSNCALMIPKTDDGRVLFAIPWYDKIVVGTTDTPIDNISLEPVATEPEINFILTTAGKYLKNPPRKSDILSVFAGLRPLALNPDKTESTKEVSRRHKIILSPSKLLTIVGGKWTTYRIMAEETVNRAVKAGLLHKTKCKTTDLKFLHHENIDLSNRLHIYGDGMTSIINMIDERPELGSTIVPALPFTRGEITWICRNEMPVNLDDILARRTRALFLNAGASLEMAQEVAAIMATELGHDLKWQKEQLETFKVLVKNYI